MSTAEEGAEPRQVTVVRPSRGLSLRLGELWHYRELLGFLVWRDIKIRYKQSAIGVLWAVIQPVAGMIIFSLIFGRVARFQATDVPYPVFVYSGLLLWTYFATSIAQSSASVVGNANLVTKVFFPRLIIPLASILGPLLDFCIAFAVLVCLMIGYGIVPALAVVTLPGFVLLAVLTALGLGLWLAALNVKYRDVPHAIPFLTQLWMFATPIIYPVTIVPADWRWLLSLNPMTGVIEGVRWGLLGAPQPAFVVVATSVVAAVALTIGGLVYFRSVERDFADVI